MISPRKRAALKRLHATTRGRRVNPPAPPELANLADIIAEAHGLASTRRNPVTIRKVAKLLDVADVTLARWLAGTDLPAAIKHDRIRSVALQAGNALAALKREKPKAGK
jgi:hypothetical protein